MSSAQLSYKYNFTMLRQRRKTDVKSAAASLEQDDLVQSDQRAGTSLTKVRNSWRDYLKFVMYCMLLAVPLYAITKSILKHDWVMVIIDALIVPVGFVHGLLLLFGYVS